jgi:UDPglucose 6-dehydrogenase
MNVTVVGTGYVGLVVGACLAETGNRVICADVDDGKIAALNAGRIPIYEPGLEPLVQRNRASDRLRFTTDVGAAVGAARVIFIAVGTPPDEDGSADLKHVLAVARTIGDHLTAPAVVITKSTVPVGTAEKVRQEIAARTTVPFHVCSNPEFLKEGAAVEDFMKPDRVVIGVDADEARAVVEELYAPFVRTGKPLIFMDIRSAEMTKYAANAMLATRISFMNQIAELCEAVGADVALVRKGIGSDPRIGPAFLFPGPGYGGSCFPKDVQALMKTGRDSGVRLDVLDAVEEVNARQKGRLFAKLAKALEGRLRGKRIAVWGLAFKAETDDMRASPALSLIERLLAEGASVAAHDPQAMTTARSVFGERITYAVDPYAALDGADALVIVTEWLVFRNPDFPQIRKQLRQPVIVDGRNLFEPDRMRALGFRYFGIGRGERP